MDGGLADSTDDAQSTDAAAPPSQKPRAPSLEDRLAAIERGLGAEQRLLDLSDRRLDDAGAERLVAALARNAGLRRLQLQRCRLTPRGFAAIGRLLEEGGLVAKRRALAASRVAAGGDATEEETTGAWADMLEQLVLSGNDCGAEGMRGGFSDGLSLTLGLRSLSLSCCCLGDEGVALLCEVLGARETGHHPGCLLRDLDISHNGFGPAGAAALAAALGRNDHLETLDVRSNEVGAEGAGAIVECIRANKGRLQKFDVSQNGLKLEGVRPVVEEFCRRIQFVVDILRPKGQPIGFNLDEDMRITGVHAAGVTERFNAEHPSEALRVGDVVLRVNAHTDAESMEIELGDAQELAIEVLRPGAGMCFIDLSQNAVPLFGIEEIRQDLGRLEATTFRGGVIEVGEGRRLNLNAF